MYFRKRTALLWVFLLCLSVTLCSCTEQDVYEGGTNGSAVADPEVSDTLAAESAPSDGNATEKPSETEAETEAEPEAETKAETKAETEAETEAPSDTAKPDGEETTSPEVELPKVEFD